MYSMCQAQIRITAYEDQGSTGTKNPLLPRGCFPIQANYIWIYLSDLSFCLSARSVLVFSLQISINYTSSSWGVKCCNNQIFYLPIKYTLHRHLQSTFSHPLHWIPKLPQRITPKGKVVLSPPRFQLRDLLSNRTAPVWPNKEIKTHYKRNFIWRTERWLKHNEFW